MRRLRVLIVEDAADLSAALKEFVECCGHDAFVASNGTDGLKMGLAEAWEVAILDLNLPGMDGLEIGRALNLRTPRPYIIAHTAFSRPIDRARTSEAGFDLHLGKGSEHSLEILERTLAELAEKGSLPPGPSSRA